MFRNAEWRNHLCYYYFQKFYFWWVPTIGLHSCCFQMASVLLDLLQTYYHTLVLSMSILFSRLACVHVALMFSHDSIQHVCITQPLDRSQWWEIQESLIVILIQFYYSECTMIYTSSLGKHKPHCCAGYSVLWCNHRHWTFTMLCFSLRSQWSILHRPAIPCNTLQSVLQHLYFS